MAETHVNSGITNKIKKLNQHKQSLLKQVQEIDRQISILIEAAQIIGEVDQLPKLRQQAFHNSIKTLVVQVLKESDKPLSANEIADRAVTLDNPQEKGLKTTAKQIKSTRMALNNLIADSMVIKSGSGRGSIRYEWASCKNKD